MNGLGVILKRNNAESALGFWSVSDRIIIMKIKAAPFNIYLIQGYAPTISYDEQKVQEFYKKIEGIRNYEKNNDVNVLMRDFSAKGSSAPDLSTIGKFRLGEIKERGGRLIDLCKAK